MSVKLDLNMDGFQQMLDTLDRMGDKAKEVRKRALDEGAKPILAAMQRKVYSVLHRRSGDLYNALKTGKVIEYKNGVASQIVGISKQDISHAFYGKFSEYGTEHEPARPWMRPAFDETQEEAYKIMQDIIMQAIEEDFQK